MKIGIVGLGLIGGSLGLSLKNEKLISCVSGMDLSKEHEKQAMQLGLVHEILTLEQMKQKCDMIFLAIPVEGIIKIVKEFEGIGKNTTIVDLGSIRQNVIPAPPMAGTEYSGPTAAFSGLFKDAVVAICDFKESGEMHVKRSVELFSHLGMKIIFMSAAEHDHHASVISHLPHAISFSLASSVLKKENKKNIIALSGTGFNGMIRIAKSSPVMWTDIFKQNKQNLINSIDLFKKELDECENLIKNEKWDELREWMGEARKIREIL